MALIDCVEWTPESNDIYAWKYPNHNLTTATQLIVHESQEAVFFSKGEIIGKFGPGKHTLSTENLPVLHHLYGLPFGKKNPFTADVWFVNKASPLTIDWKTTPMRYNDPDYNQMIPLTAVGRYGIKVQDAEKFLKKLVGTIPEFNTAQLTDHFKGPLISKTNSFISQYMMTNGIGITQISAYLDPLGEFIKEPLEEFWQDYGMTMTGFYITSVDLDTSTEDGRKIASALSDRSAQNIAGYTWQQKQGFSSVNNAVNKSNGGLGMIGAAMMMNGGIGAGNAAGSQMLNPAQQTAQRAPAAGMTSTLNGGVREVFCSNCSRKFPSTSRFCPFCGDPYNPCPMCGADNEPDAKRCVRCGASLQAANTANSFSQPLACSRCGSPYSPGTKFCQNCGNKLS